MECIITNTSGGPDLPSLAGVPQIQIAEMPQNEVLVRHRMGFQALCSPMWSVVRAYRAPNAAMTLTQDETTKLTEFIRRAQALRTWHLSIGRMEGLLRVRAGAEGPRLPSSASGFAPA